MANSYMSEPFDRVIPGIVFMVVGPALIPDPIMATLTATPLRQAVVAILGGVFLAVWVVPRVRVRGSPTVEGGEN